MQHQKAQIDPRSLEVPQGILPDIVHDNPREPDIAKERLRQLKWTEIAQVSPRKTEIALDT